MIKVFEYLKSLIKANTLDSSKSFGLLCSILTGSMLAICVAFCLVWDVCTNGYIKTDLYGLGFFTGCVGGLMFLGSAPKTISDITRKKKGINGKEENGNP